MLSPTFPSETRDKSAWRADIKQKFRVTPLK
jgi:hypothetical protein